MARLILALYLGLMGLLSLYGLHRLYLLWLFWRKGGIRPLSPPGPLREQELPLVTVQLPIYNERYVAERLLRSVAALDYPRDRLEVQVLDDSTDDTAALLAPLVQELRAAGLDVHHLRRTERTGYKAGALAAGTEQARGECVAIFDADFVVPPDFLRRVIPHFRDPGVGMVQARWGHLNRGYSLLTRVQALLLDGHFVIEHTARNRAGLFFNFNGTAGVWRAAAIRDSGGWQPDTLTEDLDLSYRAQLRGWRFVYLPELVCCAELPVVIHGYKTQQDRWTSGAVQTARKVLGSVWRADLPLRVKLEATSHLGTHLAWVVMIVLTLLITPVTFLRSSVHVPGDRLTWWIDMFILFSATFPILVFYLAAQLASSPRWWTCLRDLPGALAVGIGMSLNNGLAVLRGFASRRMEFHRTAKYRIETAADGWREKIYQGRSGWGATVEALLGVYVLVGAMYAAWSGFWSSLPYLFLFVFGYLYIAVLSFSHSVRQPT